MGTIGTIFTTDEGKWAFMTVSSSELFSLQQYGLELTSYCKCVLLHLLQGYTDMLFPIFSDFFFIILHCTCIQ